MERLNLSREEKSAADESDQISSIITSLIEHVNVTATLWIPSFII